MAHDQGMEWAPGRLRMFHSGERIHTGSTQFLGTDFQTLAFPQYEPS